jgi:hypothetical protein
MLQQRLVFRGRKPDEMRELITSNVDCRRAPRSNDLRGPIFVRPCISERRSGPNIYGFNPDHVIKCH